MMKNGDLTLNQILAAADWVDVRAMAAARMAQEDFKEATLGHETLGRLNALGIKVIADLGSDAVDRILADEVQFTWLEREANRGVVAEEATKVFFDRTGRRIPPQGLTGAVKDANRDFHLVQPTLQYDLALERLQNVFRISNAGVSLDQFENEIGDLCQRIEKNEQLSNLLKGVYLPLVILPAVITDHGTDIEQRLLPAVEGSYKAQFPDRKFVNHRKGELAQQVKVVHDSHTRLLAEIAKGPVIGLYFPNSLQGFSIPADREQMTGLPECFSLSGAVDTLTALVMYPDVLARDWNTPGLDMAALQWQSQECSLCAKADDVKLEFDYRNLDANGYYSGGMFVRR